MVFVIFVQLITSIVLRKYNATNNNEIYSLMIQISHSTKFHLFIFPKFSFVKSAFDKTANQHCCEVEEGVISNYSTFFIDFKNQRFTKLNFKKNPIAKPINAIKYPVTFPVYSIPKLDIPIDISSKPISMNNKPMALSQIKSIEIAQKPIDINISKNLNICQTHLNQQVQSCTILQNQDA